MARATKPGDKGKDSKPATAPQGKTKAQEELDRFRARAAGAQAPGGAPPSPFPVAVPWMMTAGHGGAPAWGLPPSVMPYPAMPPMQGMPGMLPMSSGAGGVSGVTDRMGSTLGLGFDVVNQLLAGSVRLLQGLAGAGYGYGAQGWGGHGHGHGCGCGCGCDPCLSDGCGHDCCGYDCCDNSCCRPSVGNCC